MKSTIGSTGRSTKVSVFQRLLIVAVLAACQQPMVNGPQNGSAISGEDERIGGHRAQATLATSWGGQDAVLPLRRIVAYYGNPLSRQMGILSEQPPDSMLARLQRQADAYEMADSTTPVQPALQLVAVVAQKSAGRDQTYRARMPAGLIEMVAQWAEDRRYLLILDVQVGLSSIAAEIDYLMPFLKRPYVHLALDPEFAMRPGQVPGEVIGTLDASDVNDAIRQLAGVVTTHRLPPKVLIVHRFTQGMLTNAKQIHLSPHVQTVIDMDGFGSPELKQSSYRIAVREDPVQYAGFKLFYKLDRRLLTPVEVLRLDPVPNVIIYQ